MIVLIMSAKPCCADQGCQDTINEIKEQAAKQSSHEKECIGCSPFFMCCSCFGFVVTNPVLTSIEVIFESPERIYASYTHPYLKEVALAIWQPPQLS